MGLDFSLALLKSTFLKMSLLKKYLLSESCPFTSPDSIQFLHTALRLTFRFPKVSTVCVVRSQRHGANRTSYGYWFSSSQLVQLPPSSLIPKTWWSPGTNCPHFTWERAPYFLLFLVPFCQHLYYLYHKPEDKVYILDVKSTSILTDLF